MIDDTSSTAEASGVLVPIPTLPACAAQSLFTGPLLTQRPPAVHQGHTYYSKASFGSAVIVPIPILPSGFIIILRIPSFILPP